MPNELLSIPINSIEADFDDFLSPDSNKRIIFSGPFGIGKTYFLDKFFKNRKPSYLPIFLRPVNYSLLSNEDVFRLIKYDILLQLINVEGFVIEKEFEFSGLEYANFFIGENKFLILQNLLKLIPKIQSTVDGIENLSKLIEAFRKGKKEINDDSDLKMLFEFQHETQDNFLLEYDHVSQFIADKLEEIGKLNSSNEPLKRVLIIDDLDRLDPEHIFRLFNVFSAHFDLVNYYANDEGIKDNKFGFDKIIFVCDIENIRKLFAHKYGVGVDFSGYIDKFYSRRIYYLFHKNSFEEYIAPYLENKFSKLDLGQTVRDTVKAFLQFLFQGNQLNIRDIYRLTDLHLSAITTKDGKFKDGEGIILLNKLGAPENSQLKNYSLCTILYIFSHHFGSSSILKEKIQNALISADSKEDEYSSYKFGEIMPSLILFADYKKHRFQIKDNEQISFIYLDYTYQITGGFENRIYREGLMWFRINLIPNNTKISKGQFLKALSEASINIIDAGILNI
ncbi:MAG: hypothetical protein JZU47_22790 [Prolixibacteraceae bacterium]|nr:hypothetical protein [Prolixibacteraceae bacterium]